MIDGRGAEPLQRVAMTDEYEKSLRLAAEYVHVVAARRGWETGQLLVAIDSAREPAIYQEHSISISVRNTGVAVTADGIPHDWIETSTGFIDTRFMHRIGILLFELEKKWAESL